MCDELNVLVKLKERAFLKRVLSEQRVEQVKKKWTEIKDCFKHDFIPKSEKWVFVLWFAEVS